MGGFGILFMLLILITVAIPIVILYISSKVSYAGYNILKRKIKPNEEYLQEIQKREDTKISRLLDRAITIMIPWYLFFSDNDNLGKYITGLWYFLFICFLIRMLVNYKNACSYLNTKSENTSTKKYLLSLLVFVGIFFLIMLISSYLVNKYL